MFCLKIRGRTSLSPLISSSFTYSSQSITRYIPKIKIQNIRAREFATKLGTTIPVENNKTRNPRTVLYYVAGVSFGFGCLFYYFDVLDAPYYHCKGMILNYFGRPMDAMASYDHAISCNPSFLLSYNNKGVLLSELGRHEEAIASYDQALALFNQFVGANNNKGRSLYSLGRYDEAIICYNRALYVNEDYCEAYNNKGLTLVALKRYDEALLCYDKSIACKRHFSEAYLNKGIALYSLDQQQEALVCFDKAISLNSKYYLPFWSKGLVLFTLNQNKEALKCFQKAHELLQIRIKNIKEEVKEGNASSTSTLSLKDSLDRPRERLLSQVQEMVQKFMRTEEMVNEMNDSQKKVLEGKETCKKLRMEAKNVLEALVGILDDNQLVVRSEKEIQSLLDKIQEFSKKVDRFGEEMKKYK